MGTTTFLYFTTPRFVQSSKFIADFVGLHETPVDFCRPFHRENDQEKYECIVQENKKKFTSRYCCNNNLLLKWTCCSHEEWMTMMTQEQDQVSPFSNWLWACIAVLVFIILSIICWLLFNYISQICYLWVAFGCRQSRHGYQEI